MNSLLNYYYELRFRLLKKWWCLFDNKGSFHCDVLMFHHVSDSHININESCQCTRTHFRSILQNRISDGYQFVSIEGLEELLHMKPTGKYCAVTFDDVPNNFLTAALPILEDLQIPVCLFITTEFMYYDDYLSKDQVYTLSSHPLCTIGAHTVSHPQLRKSPDSYGELIKSKEILEEIIGREVKYLAYPYGRQSSISNKVQREAKMAGYSLAFSTIPVSINCVSSKNKYFLPRVLK